MKPGRATSLLAVALGVLGCLGPSGVEVARRLEPGMERDEVLVRIAEKADVEFWLAAEAPASGDWSEAVQDPAVLGVILSATMRSPRPITSMIALRRQRFMSSDDFFLFFDAEDRLTYFQRIQAS